MAELLKKLQYRGGQIGIPSVPPEAAQIISEISLTNPVSNKIKSGKDYGLLLFFVNSQKDIISSLPVISDRKKETNLIWFAYPKKSSARYSSDINRDKGWEPLENLGFYPVRQVSIDPNWSALRFRWGTGVKKAGRQV